MDQFTVYGLCMANVSRSPTFEAVMNFELSTRPEKDRLIIRSAGVNAHKIVKNDVPIARKVYNLEAALHYGILNGAEKALAESSLAEYHANKTSISPSLVASIDGLFEYARPLLHGMLAGFRHTALIEAGIPAKFIPGMYNTIPADKIDLAVTLGEDVNQRLNESRPSNIANAVTYGSLAGRKEITDDLKGGISLARKQAAYFMDTRAKALEQIFKLQH